MTTNDAPIDDRPTIDDIAEAIRSLRASYIAAKARNDHRAMRLAACQHDAFMAQYRERIAAGERQTREINRDRL